MFPVAMTKHPAEDVKDGGKDDVLPSPFVCASMMCVFCEGVESRLHYCQCTLSLKGFMGGDAYTKTADIHSGDGRGPPIPQRREP